MHLIAPKKVYKSLQISISAFGPYYQKAVQKLKAKYKKPVKKL